MNPFQAQWQISAPPPWQMIATSVAPPQAVAPSQAPSRSYSAYYAPQPLPEILTLRPISYEYHAPQPPPRVSVYATTDAPPQTLSPSSYEYYGSQPPPRVSIYATANAPPQTPLQSSPGYNSPQPSQMISTYASTVAPPGTLSQRFSAPQSSLRTSEYESLLVTAPPGTAATPQRAHQAPAAAPPRTIVKRTAAPRSGTQPPAKKSKQAAAPSPEEDVPQSSLCVICMENPSNLLLIPCKHLKICHECGIKLQEQAKTNGYRWFKCPMCRKKVSKSIKAFI